jgi:hypothetical protein
MRNDLSEREPDYLKDRSLAGRHLGLEYAFALIAVLAILKVGSIGLLPD